MADIVFTPEQDNVYGKTIAHYLNEGKAEPEAERLTLEEMKKEFPGLVKPLNEGRQISLKVKEQRRTKMSKKEWKPETEEQFWFVNGHCCIDWKIYHKGWVGFERFRKVGNCFQTKAQAERMAEKIKKLLKENQND